MNYGISILFRAIPLAMAAFCFAYGAYVFAAGDDPSTGDKTKCIREEQR